MSLDVYLIMPESQIPVSSSGIFVRENGQTKEISETDWNKKYPDAEPVRVTQENTIFTDEVFSQNITHNLGKMAGEAGIYEALWRPEEIGIAKANQLIGKLGLGLDTLKSDPTHFKKLNPENGWGNYEGLVSFVEKYLQACQEYPEAEVSVSR